MGTAFYFKHIEPNKTEYPESKIEEIMRQIKIFRITTFGVNKISKELLMTIGNDSVKYYTDLLV